jgi:hypothetical protein
MIYTIVPLFVVLFSLLYLYNRVVSNKIKRKVVIFILEYILTPLLYVNRLLLTKIKDNLMLYVSDNQDQQEGEEDQDYEEEGEEGEEQDYEEEDQQEGEEEQNYEEEEGEEQEHIQEQEHQEEGENQEQEHQEEGGNQEQEHQEEGELNEFIINENDENNYKDENDDIKEVEINDIEFGELVSSITQTPPEPNQTPRPSSPPPLQTQMAPTEPLYIDPEPTELPQTPRPKSHPSSPPPIKIGKKNKIKML